MREGKITKLGDVFDITSSKRVFQSDWTTSGVPFYRTREIVKLSRDGFVDNSLFITEQMFNEFKEKYGVPQHDDILVTGVGTLGICYIVQKNDRFYFKDGNVIWMKNKGIACPRYVVHLFNTPELKRQIAQGGSTTVGTFTIERAKETKIFLPPLPEQKRIAAILDKADEIRRKREEAIRLCDEFLKSVFLEMFGDGETTHVKYETAPLVSLLARGFQNGAYYPKEYYTNDGSGTEMVHMSNAFYDTVDFHDIKRVAIDKDQIEKYSLSQNDILIARRSLNYEGAAKPCRIPKIDKPLIFESSLIRVTPDMKLLHPLYLFYYLTVPSIRRKYLVKHITQSTISGINQGNLSQVNVIVPPMSKQMEFVGILKKLDLLKERSYESLSHLKTCQISFNNIMMSS